MPVLQTVSIAPNSVNQGQASRIRPQTPHSNPETALNHPDTTRKPASHATNFSTSQNCNDSSTCFQAENTQPPSKPHTVNYEYATAARDLELSWELLQKFSSQGAIALTPRRLCPVAIRPQSGKTLGNLGVNCAGTNHCISTARKNDTTCRWQLCASTSRGTRLGLEPKR